MSDEIEEQCDSIPTQDVLLSFLLAAAYLSPLGRKRGAQVSLQSARKRKRESRVTGQRVERRTFLGCTGKQNRSGEGDEEPKRREYSTSAVAGAPFRHFGLAKNDPRRAGF